MQRSFLIFLLTFSALFALCQKEANIWYFGNQAGLDFNSGQPVALTDGAMNTKEGCTAISDENGNLLFYTDGITVWNKNHDTLLNGTDLLGNPSSTQSAIITSKPQSSSNYYIFTMSTTSGIGLNYSEVDMSLDAGLGGISGNKNAPLNSNTIERLTAIEHANGTDIWVIVHEEGTNAFYAYLVSSSGVNPTPVISNTGIPIFNSLGQLKASPDGKFVALAVSSTDRTLLCNFDNATGMVSNPITIVLNDALSFPYGVEFSPSSEFLYVSMNAVNGASMPILQYDLMTADIPASQVAIDFQNNDEILSLQLGPDEKIYIAQDDKSFLSVINSPNNKGNACNLAKDAISLNGKMSRWGLPNFLNTAFLIDSVSEVLDTAVVSGFFVPSAFSPNEDATNEEFSPKTEMSISNYSMLIFSRWGELIYQSNDLRKGWDGKKNGKSVPIGMYTAKIEYTEGDEKVEIMQSFQLIR